MLSQCSTMWDLGTLLRWSPSRIHPLFVGFELDLHPESPLKDEEHEYYVDHSATLSRRTNLQILSFDPELQQQQQEQHEEMSAKPLALSSYMDELFSMEELELTESLCFFVPTVVKTGSDEAVQIDIGEALQDMFENDFDIEIIERIPQSRYYEIPPSSGEEGKGRLYMIRSKDRQKRWSFDENQPQFFLSQDKGRRSKSGFTFERESAPYHGQICSTGRGKERISGIATGFTAKIVYCPCSSIRSIRGHSRIIRTSPPVLHQLHCEDESHRSAARAPSFHPPGSSVSRHWGRMPCACACGLSSPVSSSHAS